MEKGGEIRIKRKPETLQSMENLIEEFMDNFLLMKTIV